MSKSCWKEHLVSACTTNYDMTRRQIPQICAYSLWRVRIWDDFDGDNNNNSSDCSNYPNREFRVCGCVCVFSTLDSHPECDFVVDVLPTPPGWAVVSNIIAHFFYNIANTEKFRDTSRVRASNLVKQRPFYSASFLFSYSLEDSI